MWKKILKNTFLVALIVAIIAELFSWALNGASFLVKYFVFREKVSPLSDVPTPTPVSTTSSPLISAPINIGGGINTVTQIFNPIFKSPESSWSSEKISQTKTNDGDYKTVYGLTFKMTSQISRLQVFVKGKNILALSANAQSSLGFDLPREPKIEENSASLIIENPAYFYHIEIISKDPTVFIENVGML